MTYLRPAALMLALLFAGPTLALAQANNPTGSAAPTPADRAVPPDAKAQATKQEPQMNELGHAPPANLPAEANLPLYQAVRNSLNAPARLDGTKVPRPNEWSGDVRPPLATPQQAGPTPSK
jgi:hypothetical protein